jgi:hypothetical protein
VARGLTGDLARPIMDRDDLDIPNIKSYWIKEADEALTVAEHLFEKGDYSYALFFGHLAIEKY